MIRLGRPRAARRLLRQLTDHPEASTRLRAEAHQLLSEVELASECFRRARRHLVAAIRLRRHADDLYVAYALVVEADPAGDPRKAVAAMRVAVGIDPYEARSWALLGRMAIAAGDRKLARKALRRAERLAPDAPAILSDVVNGLVDLGREPEARAVLSAARFRAPRDARIAALWDRFRFDQAARGQQSRAKSTGRVILSLPARPTDVPAAASGRGILRADRRSRPAPHVLRMFRAGADRRSI
jgi:Flp pilus assembly protein TadD